MKQLRLSANTRCFSQRPDSAQHRNANPQLAESLVPTPRFLETPSVYAGFSALRSSLSRAQTHPCVILSGGWWLGGSEGSSEAQRAIGSKANACHYVLPSDSARPNRGAGSGCPKQLLYAPGLILRFTPSHPTSLRMTLNLQCFFSQVQRPRCERAQDDTNLDLSVAPGRFFAART